MSEFCSKKTLHCQSEKIIFNLEKQGMNLIIEKAKERELHLVIQLLKELYLELGEEEESIQFLDKSFISKIIDSGKTEIYLVRTNNKIEVGLMTLTECQSIYAGGEYGLLDEMYVRPEYRSNKIGAKLIEKIKEIGKERRWKRIDVTAPTEERWQRTVDFYKKSGFVFTGPKFKLRL